MAPFPATIRTGRPMPSRPSTRACCRNATRTTRRCPSRVALAVLAAATLVVLSRPALAAPCSKGVAAWAERCSKRIGLDVRPDHCAPGLAVVSLRRGQRRLLDVQIDHATGRAFHRVGSFGLSPVGDFPDWSKVRPERRQALDSLGKCIAADASLPLDSAVQRSRSREATGQTGSGRRLPLLPWRFILAVLLGAAACGLLLVRRAPSRKQLLTAAALVAATVACFLFRHFAVPRAFFHQNGHGPEWVRFAFKGKVGRWVYGPGFAELFRFAARHAHAPEAGVFLEQALLGALEPMAAWLVARRSGASSPVAGAIALGVGLDPTLARLSQSESYFAAGASLYFIAAALLASGAYHARVRSPRFVLSVMAAGLIVAQAARMQPLLWMGAACLPAVLLVGPGRLRTRVELTVAAGAGIGAVVALTTGPTLLAVIEGPLGRQWSSAARSRSGPGLLVAVLAALAMVPLLRRAPRSRRRLWIALALGAGVLWVAASVGNTLGDPNPAVTSALYRLFWPSLIAPLAALPSILTRTRVRAPRRPIVAAVVAGIAMIHSVGFWRQLTRLPTDAREQNWALEWRAKLPPGSLVAYVSGATKWSVALPLYRDQRIRVRAIDLTESTVPPALSSLGPDAYYYRSSICSSKQAAGFCRRIEQTARLEPLASRRFPAIPSMRWNHYTEDPVRVELFQVRKRPH